MFDVIFFGTLPFQCYWFFSYLAFVLEEHDHKAFNDRRNIPKPRDVFINCLLITLVFAAAGLLLPFVLETNLTLNLYNLSLMLFIIEVGNYVTHYMSHQSKERYKQHKKHHSLYVPYSFGGLYGEGSPILGIIGVVFVAYILNVNMVELTMANAIGFIFTVWQHVGNYSHHYHHHATDITTNFESPCFEVLDILFGTHRRKKMKNYLEFVVKKSVMDGVKLICILFMSRLFFDCYCTLRN